DGLCANGMNGGAAIEAGVGDRYHATALFNAQAAKCELQCLRTIGDAYAVVDTDITSKRFLELLHFSAKDVPVAVQNGFQGRQEINTSIHYFSGEKGDEMIVVHIDLYRYLV